VEVVGVIEPGAQRAAEASRSRKAVVIGTEATISSHAYRQALARRNVESSEKACPLLVPLVEEGWTSHPVTEQVAKIYLAEAFADGFTAADVLLLGCTHYPLLKPMLHRIVPEQVTLVDSAESTALAVANLLGNNESTRNSASGKRQQRHSPLQFFVTDSVQKFERLGKFFLGRPIEEITHVELNE
jgi:glutamate racemase